jgi:dCMP deaminase
MNWHQYFLTLCETISQKSKDPTTKVGAVIVGPTNEVRSTGYNGFPRGVDDSKMYRYERPAKYVWTCHAEINAICAAAKVGTTLGGCLLYCSLPPCMECAKAITQVGIREVVYNLNRHVVWDSPKYRTDLLSVESLFMETKILMKGVGV